MFYFKFSAYIQKVVLPNVLLNAKTRLKTFPFILRDQLIQASDFCLVIGGFRKLAKVYLT